MNKSSVIAYMAIGLVLALLITIGTTAYLVVHNSQVSDKRAVKNNALQRQLAVIGHGQCLRLNDGRRRIRVLAEDIQSILVSGSDLTPEQQKAVNKLLEKTKARGAVVLPGVDCDKAAPMPKNPTAAEKAQLPKELPIPKLTGRSQP